MGACASRTAAEDAPPAGNVDPAARKMAGAVHTSPKPKKQETLKERIERKSMESSSSGTAASQRLNKVRPSPVSSSRVLGGEFLALLVEVERGHGGTGLERGRRKGKPQLHSQLTTHVVATGISPKVSAGTRSAASALQRIAQTSGPIDIVNKHARHAERLMKYVPRFLQKDFLQSTSLPTRWL